MGSLFFEGLILQASLIFALGAQNLFVLESGLKRQHHLMVSLVCFLCDLTLILLGVIGAASLFTKFPFIKIMVGILGVTFLFTYGIGKLFSKPDAFVTSDGSHVSTTLKKSLILAATFSILNPHAYLDAFILIGGFSAKYEAVQDRIMLGLGAGVYSGVWFLILSTLSSVMKPLLENQNRMRFVMSGAGAILVFLSGKLSLDVFEWVKAEMGISETLGLVSYPHSPGMLFTSILY